MIDDIFLPDETEDSLDDFGFEKTEVDMGRPEPINVHPSGVNASNYVKITFGRFVTLVANHSFPEVVSENGDEEIIISTNLLTDLANARRFVPSTRVPLMILGGMLFGILVGYIIFNGA